jgi:hypothetical protein
MRAVATAEATSSIAFVVRDLSHRGGIAMFRQCSHCGEPFTAHDLCKDITNNLEAERMANGVDGVAFRVYTCSRCGRDDVFVDVCALPGESDTDYQRRKHELERLVAQVPQGDAALVLAERPGHGHG